VKPGSVPFYSSAFLAGSASFPRFRAASRVSAFQSVFAGAPSTGRNGHKRNAPTGPSPARRDHVKGHIRGLRWYQGRAFAGRQTPTPSQDLQPSRPASSPTARLEIRRKREAKRFEDRWRDALRNVGVTFGHVIHAVDQRSIRKTPWHLLIGTQHCWLARWRRAVEEAEPTLLVRQHSSPHSKGRWIPDFPGPTRRWIFPSRLKGKTDVGTPSIAAHPRCKPAIRPPPCRNSSRPRSSCARWSRAI